MGNLYNAYQTPLGLPHYQDFGQMETLEEACAVHGLDLDFVLAKLNELNVDGELSQDEKNN